MSNTTARFLSQATIATFEELALLFPETELTPEQEAEPYTASVSVSFRGPFAGRLVVRASASVLPAITANMLGADQSEYQPLQRDALGEMANVICGHVLPAIGGSEVVFNLAAPLVHIGADIPRREGDEPSAQVVVGVEGGRAEVSLYVFSADGSSGRHRTAALAA